MIKKVKMVTIATSLLFLLTYEVYAVTFNYGNTIVASVENVEELQYHFESKDEKVYDINEKCNTNIVVNDKRILLDFNPIYVNDSIYISIKTLGNILGVKKIEWNGTAKEVTLIIDDNIVIAKSDSGIVKVNEVDCDIDDCPVMYQEKMYVPIRAFSSIFSVKSFEWNNDTNSINITKDNLEIPNEYVFVEKKEEVKKEEVKKEEVKKEEVKKEEVKKEEVKKDIKEQVSTNYSEEEVYWLSRIVEAEAKGQVYDCKLAVANVIMNRGKSKLFPSTIKGVIFDKTYGVQFSPTVNGAIYNNPSSSSIKAAKEALSGKNNIENCLYFLPKSSNSWAAKNRKLYKIIGGQAFYF